MASQPDPHVGENRDIIQSTGLSFGHGGCSQLRLEIKSLATPEGRNVARERQFYPSNKLRGLLSREKVLDVLSCRCSDCKRRIEFQRDTNNLHRLCENILSICNVPCFHHNDALTAFALLTYIECPQFIAPLLRLQHLDRLPNTFEGLSADFLMNNVWPQFDRKHTQESHHLADAFSWQKYKFFVCSVTNEYQEFDKHTILPYINERPLDEGGFGKVYSFEIVDGYRHRLRPKDVRRFARKELHNPIPRRFNIERTNLELIRHAADPHLISIVKAYKHGEYFNFIFPCARTNLDIYLRDPQLQTPSMFSQRIQHHHFWKQMLGLAGALKKIHSFKLPGSVEDSELYGYHFDIKPANILVMDNGIFVVTDFGQANFKRKERGTSRVTGMGGTEAYAPPEFEERDSRPNRKYDVWSLGCVFLEICTFIALRYEGVNKLDTLKNSKSADGHREYESFYEDSKPNTYQLKGVICEWIDQMPDSEAVSDEEGRHFLCEMLAVIIEMLQVEVSKRLTSEQVCNRMNGVMRPYLPSTPPTIHQGFEHAPLSPGEVELGAGNLSKISGLRCLIQENQLEGPIRIIENTEGEVRLQSISSSQLTNWDLGFKAEIALVPQYTSTHESRQAYSGSHIVLEYTGDNPMKRGLTSRFILEDARTAVAVQSALLGQEVKRSLCLNDIEIHRDPQRLSRLFGRKPKHANESIGRGYVQLWLAGNTEHSDTTHNAQSRRLPSRASQLFTEGPAKRRIVIITSNTIYTIPFSKAVRLKPRTQDEISLTLQIVPTDEMTRPSITASKITGGTEGAAPAIPLDRAKFEHQESTSHFQCQSLALTFQCLDDIDVFWNTYQSMKETWKVEDAKIQRARGVMGQVLGYAPSSGDRVA